MHERECVEKVGLWNESLDRLEDYEFLIRLSAMYDFYHVKKVTCEYRYYLDYANSITEGREKYLTALQEIYHQYPVSTRDNISARQSVVDALREQVRMIDQLKRNAGNSAAEKRAVNWQIIRVVTGL